jgi:hypothetical protein
MRKFSGQATFAGIEAPDLEKADKIQFFVFPGRILFPRLKFQINIKKRCI